MKNCKKMLIAIVCVFICCSHEKSHLSANTDTDRLKFFLQKAGQNELSHFERSKYNIEAFTILVKQKNFTLYVKEWYKVTELFFQLNDWKNFKKSTDSIYKKSQRGV